MTKKKKQREESPDWAAKRNFRMPDETHAELRRLADSLDISMAKFLCALIHHPDAADLASLRADLAAEEKSTPRA